MSATHVIVIDERTAPVATGVIMAMPGTLADAVTIQRHSQARAQRRRLELGDRAYHAERWQSDPDSSARSRLFWMMNGGDFR